MLLFHYIPNYNNNMLDLESITLSLSQLFVAISKLKPKLSHGSDDIPSIFLKNAFII